MPQPVAADMQNILSNLPYFSTYPISEWNFLLFSTKSILFNTNAFMKFSQFLCISSLLMDYFVIQSKRFVESMTKSEKSVYESTFHPFEINPVLLYIIPAVSQNFNWIFLRPYNYVYFSQDLYASIVSDVVLAFGLTALIFLPTIFPNSQDFPEFTGPIRPTLRAYAFSGLFHFPLYFSALTSSAFQTNLSSGIQCFGVMYLTGRPRLIAGVVSYKFFGYCDGKMALDYC